MTTLNINLKNLFIILGLIGGLIGNVFFIGELFDKFELLKDDVAAIQENQNVIQIEKELLELKYELKTLRLEINGDKE